MSPDAQHLRLEHRRLHGLILDVRDACRVADAESCTAGRRLYEAFSGLYVELKRHFAQEEEGGCLEQAVTLCPSLAEEVAQAEREHPLLLARLERLLEVIQMYGVKGSSNWEKQFADLARALHSHEAREDRVLAQAFGIPAGLDIEPNPPAAKPK
mgnify:CR=1 FL=1